MKLIILVLSVLVFTSSCLAKEKVISGKSLEKWESYSVSIMTFNVENLFDTQHDKGKTDYTFLPLSQKKSKKHIKGCKKISRKKWRDQCLYWDWSEKVLTEKLKRISGSIKQVNQGLGPDVIVFQEIENLRVLELLRNKYLTNLGYKKSILIEGRDKRGIDVAFMSKLPVVGKPKLSLVPYKNISRKRKKDTRGILQQDFRFPDGTIVTGFATHFPAPYHPYKLRVESYKYLNELIEKLPKGRLAFAGGDFNTPAKEDSKYKILDKYVKTHWKVPHEINCEKCMGTNYYAPKKSWSFLDMMLISNNIDKTGWSLKKTFIANKSEGQTSKKNRPNSFKLQGDKVYGVSDHWPLVVVLSKKKD